MGGPLAPVGKTEPVSSRGVVLAGGQPSPAVGHPFYMFAAACIPPRVKGAPLDVFADFGGRSDAVRLLNSGRRSVAGPECAPD
jgi:hypothetical protein